MGWAIGDVDEVVKLEGCAESLRASPIWRRRNDGSGSILCVRVGRGPDTELRICPCIRLLEQGLLLFVVYRVSPCAGRTEEPV